MTALSWRLSVLASRVRTTLRYLMAIPRVYRNWWAVGLAKLGGDVTLELRRGGRYLVRGRTSDLAAVNEAVILNPYLKHPRIHLADDAVVVDVGAHIGDFTIQAARRCPRGRVVAVEPVADHARMIGEQVRLNGLSNVEIVQAALGASAGETKIAESGLSSRPGAGRNGQPVAVTTLAALARDRGLEAIDLLKLDCEGAEWDVLPTAGPVLQTVRQIAMEFHCERGWTPARLAEWLRGEGFQVWHTAGPWNGLLWATRSYNPL